MLLLGWRKVPTSPSILGKVAQDCMPSIWQGFVQKPKGVKNGIDFDRILYVIRREFEKAVRIPMWLLFKPNDCL